MDSFARDALLRIARHALHVRLGVTGDACAAPTLVPDEPIGGLFVTLHHGSRLRGCVGRIGLRERDIAALVQEVAGAVLEDPRFTSHPVTPEELPLLSIEVSLLSQMVRTADPMMLQPGVHGVYLRHGDHSGLFLPQVATRLHWNAEQMLSHCCADKAGLAPDCWRDPATEVYLFTADIFAEPGHG